MFIHFIDDASLSDCVGRETSNTLFRSNSDRLEFRSNLSRHFRTATAVFEVDLQHLNVAGTQTVSSIYRVL